MKLQRLEKETRELGAARESLRHAQAKMTELEKTNRKLLGQKNTNQKEIVRLREELHAVKAKVCVQVGRLVSDARIPFWGHGCGRIFLGAHIRVLFLKLCWV